MKLLLLLLKSITETRLAERKTLSNQRAAVPDAKIAIRESF
jgi:hypothetical protein